MKSLSSKQDKQQRHQALGADALRQGTPTPTTPTTTCLHATSDKESSCGSSDIGSQGSLNNMETPEIKAESSAEFEDVLTRNKTIEQNCSNANNDRELAIQWTKSYDEPPDGGREAWTQACCAHLVVINCWGWIQSFGVFQAYFTSAFHEPPSTISWIGSLQVFLLFGVGTFSGRALDAGFFKHTIFIGLAFQMLGMFTLSASKTYWQALLSGGVVQGFGAGLTFCPTVALVSTYFTKKRAFAVAIGASGSGVGGILYPLIVRSLLPKIGFGWTVRVCGFVMGTLGVIAGLMLRTRVTPRKAGPIVELAAFRETSYALFCIAALLFFCGIFFPFYYVSSYSRDIIDLSYADSAIVLIMINTIGVFSRLGPNFIADRTIGAAKMLVVALLSTAIVCYAWAAVHNEHGLWTWAAFFAIAGSSVQGLFPAALSTLTADPRKQGTRMGMGFFFAGVGALIGSPIGGALISANGGRYLYAQMFTGSAILAGFAVSLASVWAAEHEKPGKPGWRSLITR